MSQAKDHVKAAAMKLDPAEREALAEELLLSLGDVEQSQIEAAWLDESRRRDAAYAAGKMGATPVDQVIERLEHKARS